MTPISPGNETEGVLQAAAMLRAAKHAVVFTGAGISTPSGIPDFRTAASGLWQHSDPMEVASLSAFRHRPEAFFNWLRPLAAQIVTAQPNPAHLALARLQQAGKLAAVITQNIDGLHQRAGCTGVLEVHGTLETLTCPRCRGRYPAAEFLPAFVSHDTLPRCPRDAALLKPDVILFEEMLPWDVWVAAEGAARSADVFLVAGSSLEVSPANKLPGYALRRGARLIINTRSTTHLDDQADVLLHGDVAEVLPAIAAAVLSRDENPSLARMNE